MRLVTAPRTTAGDRAVHAQRDPESRCVVIVAPPPGSPARVFTEIVAALGKPIEGRAQKSTVRALRDSADLWLDACQVRRLFVLQAGSLEPEAVWELGALEQRLPVRVDLFVDEGERERVRSAAPRMIEPGIVMEIEPAIPADSSPTAPPALLVVPVSADRFATAHRRVPFAAAFADAAAVEADQRATLRLLTGALRATLAEYLDPDCLAAAARGAAVALREFAWTLRPATPAEACRYARPADAAARNREVASLQRSASALLSAVGALAILGLSEDEILGLLTRDVAGDGTAVRVGRDVLGVPMDLRPMLRAQWLAAGGEGATDGLPYLDLGGRSDRRQLRKLIEVGFEDAATPVAPLLRDRGGQDERWLLDRGLALERMPRGRPPSRIGSYDPIGFMDDLRSELAGDWQSITTTRVSCGCGRPHDPPRWDDLPNWPPPPPAHRTPEDHPWKRAAAAGRERRSSWAGRSPAA